VAWAALGQNLPTRLVDLEPITGDALAIGDDRLELHGGSELLPVVDDLASFPLSVPAYGARFLVLERTPADA